VITFIGTKSTIMQTPHSRRQWALLSLVLLLASCDKHIKDNTPLCGGPDSTVTSVKVIATGFNDPRGLKFGPDGLLYVAEAGVGGTNSSTCIPQVVPPVGPYTGSDTGSRISRVDWNGVRTTLVDHLPSSTTAPGGGSAIQGIADVQFIGNTLYAVMAGAGCSHGVPNIPNSIIRINPDHSWTPVANCSEYLMTHPVATPDPDDFEPDGTPYSATSVGGDLYITQPNQQEIDRIDPMTGKITRIVDVSILHPGTGDTWIGPTSMVWHDGNFYFGTLAKFPVVQGSAAVYKLSMDGTYSLFAANLTTVLGVAFDNHNRLYVLENTVGADELTPGLGEVVRIDPDGSRHLITSGLHLPTAMTFGPDGKLYISDWGIGPPGLGQIVQVTFNCEVVQPDLAK
jgi:hypothetical protein